MKHEIKNRLATMQVRENKEEAEQKALEIYNIDPEAIIIILELGMEYSAKPQKDDQVKNIIRAIILTLLVFYMKNRSAFTESPYYSQIVDLLIGFSGKGFLSARSALSEMGFSDFDIYRKQLLSLPVQEKHLRDKKISIHEACEEVRLSKGYTGFKGLMKSHYALGTDNKHLYAIYRIGQNLFALRTSKPE